MIKLTHYQKNKTAAKARSKAWKAANPEKVKLSNKKTEMKRKYGLSWDEYEALYNAQEGKCVICEEFKPIMGDRVQPNPLCVDHDHTTGKVRGLLCQACNVGLGNFRDDPTRLLKAIAYVS